MEPLRTNFEDVWLEWSRSNLRIFASDAASTGSKRTTRPERSAASPSPSGRLLPLV
jgi:hypothetical protein